MLVFHAYFIVTSLPSICITYKVMGADVFVLLFTTNYPIPYTLTIAFLALETRNPLVLIFYACFVITLSPSIFITFHLIK